MAYATRVVSGDDAAAVREAAAFVVRGVPVAVPTETVYGLAADIRSADGVAAVFAAKGRPRDNPLIVHAADATQACALADADALRRIRGRHPRFDELLRDLWPGPLTLLLPRRDKAAVPDAVTCGRDSVALRVPRHPVARALIAAVGAPLAAPSANRSGRPSPTTASHVLDDLAGRIPLVLDGGPCAVGVESSVVSLLADPPVLLRPGGAAWELLCEYLPTLQPLPRAASAADEEGPAAPLAPGMKYRHYAPDVPLRLAECPDRASRPDVVRALILDAASAAAAGARVGVVLTDPADRAAAAAGAGAGVELLDAVPAADAPGSEQARAYLAAHLFGLLRDLDRGDRFDAVYIVGVEESGAGRAIMNRLRKAAAKEPLLLPE
jgi:L-threonylcarbamoyladenylate synthase